MGVTKIGGVTALGWALLILCLGAPIVLAGWGLWDLWNGPIEQWRLALAGAAATVGLKLLWDAVSILREIKAELCASRTSLARMESKLVASASASRDLKPELLEQIRNELEYMRAILDAQAKASGVDVPEPIRRWTARLP